MANRESAAPVMVLPGMFETRTVYGIKRYEPNRFGDPESEDLTGWIHLDGEKLPVQTAFYGGAMVWEVVRVPVAADAASKSAENEGH